MKKKTTLDKTTRVVTTDGKAELNLTCHHTEEYFGEDGLETRRTVLCYEQWGQINFVQQYDRPKMVRGKKVWTQGDPEFMRLPAGDLLEIVSFLFPKTGRGN
jgi:hypothetical protein